MEKKKEEKTGLNLKSIEKKLDQLRLKEKIRQKEQINLIASENIVSEAVLNLLGSELTNKYCEGYPGRRYYGGCEYYDEIELIAIDLACKLFNCKYANVQPHSGSSANMAVYQALLSEGDSVLAMRLDHGGHLSHGHNVNFSGKSYIFTHYGVNEKGVIDYKEVERLAIECKPELIVAGASAYSRTIDFKKFKAIAKKVGAKLMVDMAHIAGLVATGLHPSPFPYADVVTSTTHKTLRGPRGGLILTNDEDIAKAVDKAIFPGIQGGPLMNSVAAKAQCFVEALNPKFKKYQEQVIKNTNAFAEVFIKRYGKEAIVSSGTDNHLCIINVDHCFGQTGKWIEKVLQNNNIIVNKNMVPNDIHSPTVTSGIRVGFAYETTKGMKEKQAIKLAEKVIHIGQMSDCSCS